MATYETSDINKKDELVTRWYNCDYNKAKEAVLKIMDNFKYNLVHTDDNYGEILFESVKYSTVVKITSITPIETGIDFYITKKSMLDFKKGIAQITSIYKELDKSLRFKGKGLHKNG
ncbi:MAG: hypothetical protein R3Y05_00040 [bacterium]